MDPSIDNDWLGIKNDPLEETQCVGNVARSWQWREHGINPPHSQPNKTVLENIAEDILVRKQLKIRCCDLPGYPRSTFLMVFSPDGTKVASTHGNHNVYVSELASGKHVRILKGHPRTPWCIAFHPSHPQLIGSGCLGGQVRVWDISRGGSEVWNVRNETVIASIAFHPREQLLVIATYNELYFWDWSRPKPFTKVSTNNVNEKVRYVAFDALGYKLITGISLWSNPSGGAPTVLQSNGTWTDTTSPNNANNSRRDDFDEAPGSSRSQESSGSAQDMIVNSYQNLVQRYDSLVRNYQRLFMVRHRLTNTPPPPNMIDRGTDPMETDASPSTSGWSRSTRPSTSAERSDNANPTPGPSRRQDGGDSGDGEGSSSRLLNLDVLTFDSNPTRNEDSTPENSTFGSRASLFQRLNESGRSFRTVDQNERITRLLPNPFSSTLGRSQTSRTTTTDNPSDSNANTPTTSRTSIFTSSRRPELLRRRRNSSPSQHSPHSNINNDASPSNIDSPSISTPRPSTSQSSIPESMPSTSRGSARPTMTNSSTQMSPSPVDAQTINESLDLIRDILRDSGTRLLNLITNMSLSTLASVERNMPRRTGSRAYSDEGDSTRSTPRVGMRPARLRLLNSSMPRDIFSSSSDSDSDQSLEVSIFRTRNSSFREDESRENEDQSNSPSDSPDLRLSPTDRMVIELTADLQADELTRGGAYTMAMASGRFRVRSNSDDDEDDPQPSTSGTTEERNEASTSSRTQNNSTNSTQNNSTNSTQNNNNSERPSTSRDTFWVRGGQLTLPPHEAYRKVRIGVNALQKHTLQLTNMWLRGTRVTMRELRNMWENLRRRVLMLHRETGRNDIPSYYTRSLLERCMMLTEMAENVSRTTRSPRAPQRSEGSENPEGSRTAPASDDTGVSSSPVRDSNPPTPYSIGSRQPPGRSPLSRSPGGHISPSMRRRLRTGYRWRPEDEIRRRYRNLTTNRGTPRYSNRARRDFARALEISATRHVIRVRAMQVLSVMFNMMMMCLEERGLSQVIINMLRSLKKALALTCLMLMTNRNVRSNNNPANPNQRVESLNVVRIENVEHPGPVNVDGPDDPSSPRVPNDTEEDRTQKVDKSTEHKPEENSPQPSTSYENRMQDDTETSQSAAQHWSNRLAVQIAAANRNNSATARSRRELYLESRRLKALHRTNPTAHPMIKKRALPPSSTYRIPALRHVPTKIKSKKVTSRNEPANEPVAGPSNASPPAENPNEDAPRSEVLNEFEHRVNLIRIAHLQAIRLRNAARNRFRRLQTIRLYTPSSVRDMFALQPNNSDNPPENRSPQNGSEFSRRPFAAYRPHILTPRSGESTSRGPEEPPGQFHTVLNNVAMPLMQVNDLPANPEAPSGQQQRLPRIHEYLQPIILAQNAMLVDDDAGGPEGGGGPGGPGGTKNVVVQKCRIHNDASIDISKDGRLLVALLPVPRLRHTNHWLGVYSLEWSRLGQCLHTAVLEQSAVSVALSPTARHLAVGLGSRRFSSAPHARNNVFALLYRLDPLESSSRTGLSPIKELEQNWEHGFTSLNCLRWAPQPGQGLVYANNTGQLIIMS
ncbi:uncharacterized protein LOC135087769 [Ostrinia nubilalis]|uniref:uncharacterized protein LOC135087769 n=1 Tax=Ostrinia nubilalis TaxID=29057 RepID=UPI0030822109